MNKTEKKSGLKTGHIIALLVILALNIVWLACSTLTAVRVYGTLPLSQIVNIFMFAVAVFYVLVGYKKPHGNDMKYLMLGCSVYTVLQFINHGGVFPVYVVLVLFISAIVKAFMAGRLDHYKQNVIILLLFL